ncbi:Protein FAR-RED IMPAIRED RESPONSE 1 [Nymphon striatum]|nr:Protein FAR-RED IMPAIRED RESPONSE 1 [Nymphon striatum]
MSIRLMRLMKYFRRPSSRTRKQSFVNYMSGGRRLLMLHGKGPRDDNSMRQLSTAPWKSAVFMEEKRTFAVGRLESARTNHDLVLTAESQQGVLETFERWRKGIEIRGLKVILEKAKDHMVGPIMSDRFSTNQKGCPFKVRVKATSDGQCLQITEISGDHNHVINKALYDSLPTVRKLDVTDRKMAEEMLALKANKKVLQKYLIQKTKKPILLRDLHNIAATVKKGGQDFNNFLMEMKKEEGATVEVVVDEDNVVHGVFYQDVEMKKMFEAFPELVLIDATYKLNDLQITLYLILAVDGNMESEIVAVWFLAQENREILSHMLCFFKKANSAGCEQIKVVMADKDIAGREVISEELPNAQLLVCLYHTMRNFRRDVSTVSMGISASQRHDVLEILTKITHSRNEEDYNKNYETLKSLKTISVLEYYDEKWHPVKEQWVEGFRNDYLNLMTRTNYRLESINQKLKSVITKCSSIHVFWCDLMKCITSLRDERDHRAVKKVEAKVSFSQFASDSIELRYREHLTPFAFEFVQQHIAASKECVVSCTYDTTYSVKEPSGSVQENVNIEVCTCSFLQNNVSSVSSYLGMQNACWIFTDTRNSNLSTTVTKGSSEDSTTATTPSDVAQNSLNGPCFSKQEKYQMAFNVLQSVASLVSECGMEKFRSMMEILKMIESYVKEDRDFIIMEVSNSKDDDEISEESTNDQSLECQDIHIPEVHFEEVVEEVTIDFVCKDSDALESLEVEEDMTNIDSDCDNNQTLESQQIAEEDASALSCEDNKLQNKLTLKGHSLHTPVGGWQKGKDLTWYAKDKNTSVKKLQAEIDTIQQAEEKAIFATLERGNKKKPTKI